MKNPQQIIADLKHNIYWSQPNIRFAELMALVNELEYLINTDESKNEIAEAPVVKTVEEEVVTEEITTKEVIEESTVEDTSEEVTMKKTKSKK